jgi:hypothetical protein
MVAMSERTEPVKYRRPPDFTEPMPPTMVAMSEVIDPVKIEGPLMLTKAQQRELKQRWADWIFGREEAIKQIMDRYKTTKGRARRLLKDAHYSGEVEYVNAQEEEINRMRDCRQITSLRASKLLKDIDPDCDYAWRRSELWEYLDPLLQQPRVVTEQPRLVRRRRRQDKQDWAKKAIAEIWGKDVPDEIELPPKSFYDQVIEHLKADCEARKIRWRGISEKTVSRARRGR